MSRAGSLFVAIVPLSIVAITDRTANLVLAARGVADGRHCDGLRSISGSSQLHLAMKKVGQDNEDYAVFSPYGRSIDRNRGELSGFRTGLEAAGNDFVAAFTVANNLGLPVDIPDNSNLTVDIHNRQDIIFKRIQR
jgi:hypothetical protein